MTDPVARRKIQTRLNVRAHRSEWKFPFTKYADDAEYWAVRGSRVSHDILSACLFPLTAKSRKVHIGVI